MRHKASCALVGLAIAAAVPAGAQQITGAGATFPAPVYQQWGEAAARAIGVDLNYQAIGSGGGINQVISGTVDFGATDAPLAAGRLAKLGLVQFPTLVGGIVLTINVPGVGDRELKLTGALLAEIFQERLGRWNDRRIAELNPAITLPNIPVAPVYRADASGTTFQFTDYLSRMSEDWKALAGSATSVRWPAGVGARGNDGVAAMVRNARGGIGYVEYAYARLNRLATVQLRNRDGQFVAASEATIGAAAAGVDWAADPSFAVSLNDRPGAEAWPIAASTFILVPTHARDPRRTEAVLRFFDWALREGDAIARDLVFVPLPEATKDAVRAAWSERLGFAASHRSPGPAPAGVPGAGAN
ncbi:MAG: phosphate ABC transporter substrate-binding protein PstS [Acetobacteraceae bacterium]|nr:phosphate ABC transporter substrate-binding protein PstS [Acetobacteraceae bacterium]